MRLIDADSLIEHIRRHEQAVLDDKETFAGSIYRMAHRHIIQLVEIEPTIERSKDELPVLQKQENDNDKQQTE